MKCVRMTDIDKFKNFLPPSIETKDKLCEWGVGGGGNFFSLDSEIAFKSNTF